MKKLFILLISFTIFNSGVMASDADILKRQDSMKVVKEQIGILAPMALGKANFDSFLTEVSLNELLDAVIPFSTYFKYPPSEQSKTEASSEIWSNKKDFEDKATDFVSDIKSAVLEEPQSAAELKNHFSKITRNCKACHQSYRVK